DASERLAQGGMGHLGKQSKCALLPPYSRRPQAVEEGVGSVRSPDAVDSTRDADELKGGAMGFWKEIGRRAGHLTRRSRYEKELQDEIQFHIELRAEELEKSGLSSEDAVKQAYREFGSLARSSEDSRAAWRFKWVDDLGSDLRHAMRSFR